MKDTQLYEQLLGLSKPWSVNRVELELERNRITVHVECDRGVVWGDPETVRTGKTKRSRSPQTSHWAFDTPGD